MNTRSSCSATTREVDDIVRDLVAAARTGQAVAGWVTVSDLTRAVPIH